MEVIVLAVVVVVVMVFWKCWDGSDSVGCGGGGDESVLKMLGWKCWW